MDRDKFILSLFFLSLGSFCVYLFTLFEVLFPKIFMGIVIVMCFGFVIGLFLEHLHTYRKVPKEAVPIDFIPDGTERQTMP